MEKQPNSRMCFVCGIENPIGLHLFFYTDEEGRCIARFQPREEHQGYPGCLHGGLISTLLDEVMGRVLAHREVWAMTGRLEIKFRKPVPLGEELTIVAEVTRDRGRAYEARGEIRLPDGTVLAEGNGLYLRVPDEFVEQARSALDFWEVVPD
ncbi:MAG: PaaI family thioesterase [Chloroflexi bacterium]|nr:PaaI family thioesterase [Chloroflexota bacterium]MBU1751814.1 PaaI family thioesterase [Chloroflexota bacterium]MBU1877895.1 PaaI family thioesterase [Chloroflexota bacterium]